MQTQFENPQEAKVAEKTVSIDSVKKRIDRVAEKAAKKSTIVEQQFDKVNSNLFSK
jgi:hypothetical protein